MGSSEDLGARVCAVKGDARKADELVRDYLPFITSETAKFMARRPVAGVDDELGIAMFAFHEATQVYDRQRGAFLPLAARMIRNRLIDYRRREARHARVVSLDAPRFEQDDEDGGTLLDQVDTGRDEIGERHAREATRSEIEEFTRLLASFDVKLTDVADNCPKQGRTFAACRRALTYAREHREVLDRLEQTGKLPIAALAEGSGVERKTLERHRRYLVALLLAYTNGFEIIRGHLRKLDAHQEDGAR
ncbi:sigma factor [Collinsella tanakaei]|uniref:sigma factor n=1 Tax=Collinsella tanakaei TaxID=626935 RepID=UPI0025A3F15F|nr:sigma factor [Collinsella tanakaei]MDM8301826.1 sigma factor [Collinsella tanakaei]